MHKRIQLDKAYIEKGITGNIKGFYKYLTTKSLHYEKGALADKESISITNNCELNIYMLLSIVAIYFIYKIILFYDDTSFLYCDKMFVKSGSLLCDEYKIKFGDNIKLFPLNSTLCIKIVNGTCFMCNNKFDMLDAIGISFIIFVTLVIFFVFCVSVFFCFCRLLSNCFNFFRHMREKYKQYCVHKLTVQKDIAMFEYI